jgi:hypothetical protein
LNWVEILAFSLLMKRKRDVAMESRAITELVTAKVWQQKRGVEEQQSL